MHEQETRQHLWKIQHTAGRMEEEMLKTGTSERAELPSPEAGIWGLLNCSDCSLPTVGVGVFVCKVGFVVWGQLKIFDLDTHSDT